MCPSCEGIWFDQGELGRYRRGLLFLFMKPRKLRAKLVCSACGIDVEHDGVTVLPKCSLCGKHLHFEGTGEVLTPRIVNRDRVATILSLALLTGIFAVALALFQSVRDAAMFTGFVGTISVFLIVRAVVYNRYTANIGPVVRDFDLS